MIQFYEQQSKTFLDSSFLCDGNLSIWVLDVQNTSSWARGKILMVHLKLFAKKKQCAGESLMRMISSPTLRPVFPVDSLASFRVIFN